MGVYNNAGTLPAALDSILSQEGVELELIAIDDGSTDGSGAVLDAYAKRDARLRVVHQENQGLTRSLIAGCGMARAPWIARQDADDLSLPGRLAALLRLTHAHPHAAFYASAVRCYGPRGETLFEAHRCTDPEQAREELFARRLGPPAHGSVMFSRERYVAVGGYRAPFYYGQDSDLWLRLAETGPVAYSDRILYSYQYAPGAISGAMRFVQQQFGDLGQACRKARSEGASEEPFLREAEALSRRVCAGEFRRRSGKSQQARSLYHIGCLLQRRDAAAARAYFAQAIAANPLLARAWVKWLFAWRAI